MRQVLLVAGVQVDLQTVLMVLQVNPRIKEVPEVPEAHDQLDLPREDDTMPGGQPARPHLMASSGGLPAVAAEDEEDAEAAEQPGSEPAEALGSTDGTASEEPAEAPKVKDSTLQITLLLLLLAFVGLGGLLWFVLR